jgi:cytochrome P450
MSKVAPGTGDIAGLAREFDLFDGSAGEGIYDLYQELSQQCPVAHSAKAGGFWLVTGYDEAISCLKMADVFSSASGNAIPSVEGRAWLPAYVDAPMHMKYRQDLNVLFSPQRVRPSEPDVRERARHYVKRIADNGHAELMKELCGPFPCSTFLIHLGAPVEDTEMLVHWKDTLIGAIDDDALRQELVEDVLPAMNRYFDALLSQRQADPNPPQDVLTGLANARVGDRSYTREEMLRVCGFFVIAGLDTVTSVLSRVLWYLATHPDHLAELVADRSLIPEAVEEFLRYFAAVSTGRRVTRDIEFGGQQLAEGDWVMVSTVAASRDVGAFDNAMEVDFHRKSNKHLGFGAGPHRCLGSHLARMELKVALEAIVDLMPRFSLDPDRPPRFSLCTPVYGMEELHIVVG